MEALHLIGSEDQSRNFESRKQKFCAQNCPGKPLEVFSNLAEAAFPFVPAGWSAFRGAESAHEKDDKAYQQ